MYNKPYKRLKCQFPKVVLEEGESIEEKVRKITETNEPIDNVAPMIYTDRKDGVQPQYDIRTDRWEIAQQAMDKVTATEIAKQQDTNNLKQVENETAGNQEGANAQA